MNAKSTRIAVPESGRGATPNATLLRRSDPATRIKVSIFVRRNPRPSAAVLAKANTISRQLITQRSYLNSHEFDDVYGGAPSDLDEIAHFAKGATLAIVESSVVMRRVLVEGSSPRLR
jgi:hypothetical protein